MPICEICKEDKPSYQFGYELRIHHEKIESSARAGTMIPVDYLKNPPDKVFCKQCEKHMEYLNGLEQERTASEIKDGLIRAFSKMLEEHPKVTEFDLKRATTRMVKSLYPQWDERDIEKSFDKSENNA